MPWSEVVVDLIGLWCIKVGGQEVDFYALTCIDPVTNLVEMIRLENKTAKHVTHQFENVWLARYPRPGKCIHDNGGEFISAAFQHMLQHTGVKDVLTTSQNPQANSMCKQLHQTVTNILCETTNGTTNAMQQAVNAVDD
eukprot:3700580-Ditylum_brightwellii.AAC.1